MRLNRFDLLWLLLLLAATVGEGVRLAWGRQFWSDELFGWFLARDPSLRHMFSAWRAGADGGGIVFYLLTRAWLSLFGASPAALRMLNVLGMAAALALTWITARRWYRLEIVAFTLPFCWFTAHSVLRQMAVGRFYGCLMAAVAASVFWFAALSESEPVTLPQCLAVFVVQSLLVGVHPFGALYSAVVIAAAVGVDALHHRWRPRLYIAACAGFWILWPSRAAILASAAVGKPHFWTTTPTLPDLGNALIFWTDEIEGLWIFLLACLFLRWIWMRRTVRNAPPLPSDSAALVIGGMLVAFIPVLWLVSLWGTSYFVDRYLTPIIIGAALLQCATLQRLIPAVRSRWLSLSLGLAALGTISATVWGAVWDMPRFFTIPPHTYASAAARLLPRNIPTVVERVDIFTEMAAANPELPLRYLLDWEIVTLPDSSRGEVSGYHEMENWRREGYFATSIEPSSTFLNREPEFFVITDPSELWFVRRIQHNPSFTIEKISNFQRELDTETIWHVRRLR